MSNKNIQQLFLGVDGGGSKCKAIITLQDKTILGTGMSGPGNPLHGFEQATHSIVESAQLALKDAGLTDVALSDLIAGVGLAGVNLPVLYEQMSQWQHPFKHMWIAHDLLVACLGAHNGQDGAVIISGTGSCGFSYINGQSFMIGAHGFPHGDKGSGAWFGLQATKQVLLSIDGIIPPTLLTQMLLNKLGCKDEISLLEVIVGKPATYYAQLANLVFDAADMGDELAKSIIYDGAEYINSVARSLWKRSPPRMSMIGGLTVRLKPWLAKDIQNHLTDPLYPPEVGSVLYAQQKLSLL